MRRYLADGCEMLTPVARPLHPGLPEVRAAQRFDSGPPLLARQEDCGQSSEPLCASQSAFALMPCGMRASYRGERRQAEKVGR